MDMRVLVIEDEQRLAGTLADMIDDMGYDAEVACDGTSGLDRALEGSYDAIVLDVMLPGLNGFELLSRLRALGVRTPVMMLSARTEVDDRVRGLDLGADYYLTKPFENEEFRACLRAVIRRQGELVTDRLAFGDLELMPSRSLLSCHGRELRLSAKELELMRLLMINRHTILSKETLLLKVWGYDSDAGDNNVEAYISFLRKKLTLLKSTVTLAVVRRVGYRLEEKET